MIVLQVLTNKIAERKRRKAEKMAEQQKLEVDKLLADQAAAREELDLSQVRKHIIKKGCGGYTICLDVD